MRNEVLAAALLVLAGCASASSSQPPDHAAEERTVGPDGAVRLSSASARFVEVATVRDASEPAFLHLPARVVLRDTAVSRVGAPLGGRVVEVHVDVGDIVQPGDPLVTLRSPDAAAARASLASTQASLEAARQQAGRARQLLEQGVGTERERVEADARVAELNAELARATATAGYVGRGTGATVVVRAPIAGTVLTREATPGASVEPGGGPIVEIGDPHACWIEADVFERDLPLVRAGAEARVDLATRGEALSGHVVRLGSLVRGDTRTAPVRIEVDDPTDRLHPGMFARAAISVGELGITLPTRAVLIEDGRGYIVYVASDDHTFEPRPVEVGVMLDQRVQIISGVEAGERVVVRNALLVDGAADALL